MSEFRIGNYLAVPEIRINADLPKRQHESHVSCSVDRCLVTWTQRFVNGRGAIRGRLVYADGLPLTPEILIDSSRNNSEESAQSVSWEGGFIVVWSSAEDLGNTQVRGRFIDQLGRLGNLFEIEGLSSNRRRPVVIDFGGHFAVFYSGFRGSNVGLFAQLFSENATHLTEELQLSIVSDDNFGGVSSTESGFFATWWSTIGKKPEGTDVYGRLFDNQARPLSAEIDLNDHRSGDQQVPNVAAGLGKWFVVWQSQLQDGSGWGIFGQLFNETGEPIGNEFPVNEVTANHQQIPWVTRIDDGFVVVWMGYDLSERGIRGRLFSEMGLPSSQEFSVNAMEMGLQEGPRVAATGKGWVAVWHTEDTPGARNGIYFRAFTHNRTIETQMLPLSSTFASLTSLRMTDLTTTTTIPFLATMTSSMGGISAGSNSLHPFDPAPILYAVIAILSLSVVAMGGILFCRSRQGVASAVQSKTSKQEHETVEDYTSLQVLDRSHYLNSTEWDQVQQDFASANNQIESGQPL